MLLKTLNIHNIASLEDAVIDFSGTPLRNAPIFLICGETGAGKTTILDAICLALYGETPRMTSVAKEELELTDVETRDQERYYSNDNSQLLRRGAGEGYSRLIFTGNDGRDYEAEWEIHRAHSKPGKRLLRPTRSLRALDNSFSDTRQGEIKAKIVELTGLQYDQFCRTVMLAQGEFTKFLKSSKGEKSEILEKLTGTEIYSRLGVKIAEKYNTASGEFEKAKAEVGNVVVLSDEAVEEMKQRVAAIDTTLNESVARRNVLTEKITWLKTAREQKEMKGDLEKELLRLKEVAESEKCQADRALLADYSAASKGRHLLNSLLRGEKLVEKKRLLLPEFQKEVEKHAAENAKYKEEYDRVSAELEELETAYERYGIEEIGERYNELVNRDKTLADLISSVEKLLAEEKALGIQKAQERSYRKRTKENQDKLNSRQAPLEEAKKDFDHWAEEIQKAELSTSDMVKELRVHLHDGDTCPVCGSLVTSMPHDDFFDSILKPLRDAKKRAEDKYIALGSEVKALERLIKDDETFMKTLAAEITTASAGVEKVRAEINTAKDNAGFEEFSPNEASSCAAVERKELEEKIAEIREIQKQAEKDNKEIKKVRRKVVDVQKRLSEAGEAMHKASLASEKLTSEIATLCQGRDGLEKELNDFFAENPGMTRERLEQLNKLSDKKMDALKTELDTLDDNIKLTKGKLLIVDQQMADHEGKRPELEEEETEQALSEASETLEKEIKALSEEKGSKLEQLQRDKEEKAALARKMSALDKAREEVEKWESLYKKLGDQRGAKFRAVAQSYILKSLLDNANLYMRSFNDRYTLTCNPGTLAILVKDSYKPTDPQPASILSGGESFMASLSLALALSNLRSGGMGVDILFIDEGFGTLSPEYLGNVMDTLEKLHQIGGRKVGLISHVAEMKERIPIHILVSRESPSLSRISIEA